MRKLESLSILTAMVIAVGIAAAGCGSDSGKVAEKVEKRSIRIGASPNGMPLAKSGVKPLEGLGYKVEVVPFDDIFVPNVALNEGSIDANFYQHESFMNNFNKEKNTNIIMLHPKMYTYLNGFYSKKASSIDGLPKNSRIGLSHDASNIDRELRLLNRTGMIKLKHKDKGQYSIADIADNPKNLSFVHLEVKQRIAALDELEGIISGSTFVFLAGLNPMDNLLYKEVDENYAIGICINGTAHKADDVWIKDLVAAYTSDEACRYVQEYFKGAYIRTASFESMAKSRTR